MKKFLSIFLFVLLLGGIGAGTAVLLSNINGNKEIVSITSEVVENTDQDTEETEDQITAEVEEIVF